MNTVAPLRQTGHRTPKTRPVDPAGGVETAPRGVSHTSLDGPSRGPPTDPQALLLFFAGNITVRSPPEPPARERRRKENRRFAPMRNRETGLGDHHP